ncbi:MAG: hypothetical protein JWN40_5179 [Phycisphaerales bacterium]|nr:hypothetical protein [Phycisphaerales bacterium]
MVGLSRAICIPRFGKSGGAAAPRELMEEWLAARKFEPHPGIPQWPCDDQLERGFFLFTNERWVILLYSGIDAGLQEDNRLLLHLARAGVPLLYVWSAGTMWGYRIHEGREVLDAYHSGHDLAPEWLTEYPGHGDLQFLCEMFGLSARPRMLEQIRRSRVIAGEDVVARFCEELGVAPAAVGYGAVEWHFLTRQAVGTFDGFTMERGYYVKQGFRPGGASLKLHEIPARAQGDAGANGWWPPVEIDPGYLLAILRLSALITAILLPIQWAFVTIFKTASWTDRFYRLMGWNQRSMHPSRFAREFFADASRDAFDVQGERLVNQLRRCEVMIPNDARATPRQCAGVFAFTISKVTVNCDAVRPDAEGHIRRMFFYPQGYAIVADEMFVAGSQPARHIGWKLEHDKRTMFVNHWIVQTPEAYFEFSCRTDSAERVERILPLMRRVVESFRITQAAITADTSAAAATEPKA